MSTNDIEINLHEVLNDLEAYSAQEALHLQSPVPAKLAEVYGVSVGTMRRAINRAIKLTRANGRQRFCLSNQDDANNQFIYEEACAGTPYSDIAAAGNPPVTREWIRQIIRDMGLPSARDFVAARRAMFAKEAIPLIAEGKSARDIARILSEDRGMDVEYIDIVDLFNVGRGMGPKSKRYIPGLADAIQTGERIRPALHSHQREEMLAIRDRAAIALWVSRYDPRTLSAKSGVGYQAIHQVIRKKRTISRENARKLASFVNVDAEWIFTGSPWPKHIPAKATWTSIEKASGKLADELNNLVRTCLKDTGRSDHEFLQRAGIPAVNWARMLRLEASPHRYEQVIRETVAAMRKECD